MEMKSFTATIRKGEKQYVALCQELDVVSQGYTVEEAIKNLKEAVELHIEEEGLPEELTSNDTIVVNFEVKNSGKASKIIR
ncbi:type II toxin-antitoxin system HicB family antitoxin [Candidatus Pacearchaeota archaeon]|nr:type II toxin-antitoxin system HicB family antitoxin [Candidatus Pacearchaeota archaeon]